MFFPKRLAIYLLSILFLSLFLSCQSEQKQTVDPILSGKMLHEISAFQNENELLITYYLNDHSDWMLVKDKLLHQRNVLLEKYPKVKSLALVCYSSKSQTPIVTSNPNFAWNHEFDNARLCSMDNNHGFWRYCYGGTSEEAGKQGEWREIMPLE